MENLSTKHKQNLKNKDEIVIIYNSDDELTNHAFLFKLLMHSFRYDDKINPLPF